MQAAASTPCLTSCSGASGSAFALHGSSEGAGCGCAAAAGAAAGGGAGAPPELPLMRLPSCRGGTRAPLLPADCCGSSAGCSTTGAAAAGAAASGAALCAVRGGAAAELTSWSRGVISGCWLAAPWSADACADRALSRPATPASWATLPASEDCVRCGPWPLVSSMWHTRWAPESSTAMWPSRLMRRQRCTSRCLPSLQARGRLVRALHATRTRQPARRIGDCRAMPCCPPLPPT